MQEREHLRRRTILGLKTRTGTIPPSNRRVSKFAQPTKAPKVQREVSAQSAKIKKIPRPDNPFLTSLLQKTTKIILPEKGSFNAGLVAMPDSTDYICVYRPDEYSFIGCILGSNLQVKKDSFFKFNITNCADPRLIWLPNKQLLMVYSSTEEVGLKYECIRGNIIMDLNQSNNFISNASFRISPQDGTRHKNWMPFMYDDEIYLVATVCPHIIYKLNINGAEVQCQKVYETPWINPWMYKEFLRGNTNIVQLNDGNFLGTFHTAVWFNQRCFYDNGAYLFEGKPPFKVLKCANRTYLKAEDATEPHFRKGDILVCNFPVGLVKQDDKLLISYGDNDSVVKIMETTVSKMLNLMLDVY
jgi:predicted GH43/DUF377 family glycosyl hydrolase